MITATEYKYTPALPYFKHQLKCLTQSWDKKSYALFMDMGTGKSKVLIDTTCCNYELGTVEALLIIAPKGGYRNWDLRELPKHMPERIRYKAAYWRAWSSMN